MVILYAYMVDKEATSHCEITAGPPKFRIAIPKNTRLKLGLHELEEGEKAVLDADFSVAKVVDTGGDGSE